MKSGVPEWMVTFTDLTNLLLCFFILMFAFSSVESEKFQELAASFQQSFSILPGGGSEGILDGGSTIGSELNQIPNLNEYKRESTAGENTAETESIKQQFQAQALAESERMTETIRNQLDQLGIGDRVEVEPHTQFVQLTLGGALLFDSGSASLRSDAMTLVERITRIVEGYAGNIIAVEGHTDNIPILDSQRYDSNDTLAYFRAQALKNFFTENSSLDPATIRATSFGDSSPIADNSTEEGRARNRRVEIKIYNSFNSGL
jgi:chemotaxis protein MotB